MNDKAIGIVFTAVLVAGLLATGAVIAFDHGGRKALHVVLLTLFFAAIFIVLFV